MSARGRIPLAKSFQSVTQGPKKVIKETADAFYTGVTPIRSKFKFASLLEDFRIEQILPRYES
jgi:hypothetical protein